MWFVWFSQQTYDTHQQPSDIDVFNRVQPAFFLPHATLFTHSYAPPDSKRTLEILTSVSPNFKKSNTFCWRVSCPASSRFTHSISNYVPGKSPGFVHRSRRQGRWPWQIFSFIRSFKAPNQLHIPFLSVYYPSINATCVRQLNGRHWINQRTCNMLKPRIRRNFRQAK